MAETKSLSPLQSKKFISYLLFMLLMKPILLFSIYYCVSAPAVLIQLIPLTIIIVDGFVAAGYILGQAGLDKFIRMSQIAADAGMGVKAKGISFGPAIKLESPESSLDPPTP